MCTHDVWVLVQIVNRGQVDVRAGRLSGHQVTASTPPFVVMTRGIRTQFSTPVSVLDLMNKFRQITDKYQC